MKNRIRVATRPSKLAYTQTVQTVALLQEKNPHTVFEIIKFSTQGDRDQKSTLTSFGGTGIFVKELENALLNDKADMAIHSLKDMPSIQPEALYLASFPKREDPRDVFIAANTPIKVVGTGSPRRVLQCAIHNPEVTYTELRGNVDTRIAKMQSGFCDATYLAVAGLKRLGIQINEAIEQSVEDFIPAIGQGALAIECRMSDVDTQNIARSINDTDTMLAVKAERAFMKEVEGGCKFPLAAHAYINNNKIHFLAIIGELNTYKYVKREEKFEIDKAEESAIKLAKEMKNTCLEKNINLEF